MIELRIIPVNKKRGLVAPFVTIYVDKNEQGRKIEKMARAKSGLGRFEEWNFGEWGQNK
jgi:hypothetical protein